MNTKLIGLIGGTSWVSTMDYYRMINEGINAKLGGSEFARCIIYSLNYGDIRRNNDKDDWDANLQLISEAAKILENGGAKAIVLCANTMHLLADRLQTLINIPILHIATATAAEIKKKNLKKIGLLGTKLSEKGIEKIIPGDDDRDFIHHTIFDELGKNILRPKSKERYLSIIRELIDNGAEGIILGCTEIPLLIKQEDVPVPVFDTALIHSSAAVEFALS